MLKDPRAPSIYLEAFEGGSRGIETVAEVEYRGSKAAARALSPTLASDARRRREEEIIARREGDGKVVVGGEESEGAEDNFVAQRRGEEERSAKSTIASDVCFKASKLVR